MPRNRVKGKPVDADGAELKAVRLELPVDVHQWLRVEAAKNGKSMAMYARWLIEREHKAKSGA